MDCLRGPTRVSSEPQYWAGLIVPKELTSAATEQWFIQLSCAFFAVPVERVRGPLLASAIDKASSHPE